MGFEYDPGLRAVAHGDAQPIRLECPTADQAALEQLLIYGLLYVRRQGLRQRRDLTLWLMATSSS